MAFIIDGKKLSAEIIDNIRESIKNEGLCVGLAVVLVGDDPASKIYVSNKIKRCEETGIRSYSYYLPADTTEEALTELIRTLDADASINGILVQLPLPRHIDERKVLQSISHIKDVDGFTSHNAGRLFLGESALEACTPSGIMELIRSTGVTVAGKNAVVVGRSNTVGKPVAIMLLRENATVTIAHSKTSDLSSITKAADILVAAVGKKHLITADMVKPGAVVIDVGMNRGDKLYGDVDFDNVKEVASFITPVPGGVGPMTIAMLLKNTLSAARRQKKISNA